MTRVDAYASLPHYADHLQPILDDIPKERRGQLHMPANLRREPACAHLTGVQFVPPPSRGGPLLVAGYQDLPTTRRSKVLVNHGAGQVYKGWESGSYAGGPGRDLARLFLHPNEHVAELDRARYPHARSVAVGCPKLDAYMRIPKPHNDPPVVAVAFHWPCRLPDIPEAGWAFPTWADTIIKLAETVKVLGHAHPRARRELGPWYREHGIEECWSPTELLARADCLVLDNSSFGFEWGACDRPTVWLRDASWRVDVEHGLRFGDELPGMDIRAEYAGDLDALQFFIAQQTERPSWTAIRRRTAERIYGPIDGHASERAAAAVMALAEERC